MFFLLLFLIFLGVGVAIWFQGAWNAAVTLLNMIIAMMIATNYFEPFAASLEEGLFGLLPAMTSYTYLLDVLVLWLLFAITFGILRAISDGLSRKNVKFNMPVEMTARSLLAIWCAWLMVCFTTFSLQMAPLNDATPLGAFASPTASSFLGMSPDRQWLAFMQSRSRGAMARGNFSGKVHPDDQTSNVEAFDPFGEFPIKYRERRERLAKEEALRVN